MKGPGKRPPRPLPASRVVPAGRLLVSAAMLKIVVLGVAAIGVTIGAIVHQHERKLEPMVVTAAHAPSPPPTEIPAPDLEAP